MPHLIHRLTALFHKKDALGGLPIPEATPAVTMTSQTDQTSQAHLSTHDRQAYLYDLIAGCRPVPITYPQFHGDTPASRLFLLDRLYVPPDVQAIAPGSPPEGEPATPSVSTVMAALATGNQRVVVTGAPGQGKTSLLRYLALQHARALSSSEADIQALLPEWPGVALLPVLISLPEMIDEWVKHPSPAQESIENYLHGSSYSRNLDLSLLEEADRTGGLYLFDGLDEISQPALASQLVTTLQTFTTHHATNPATRFIVTCRSRSYRDPLWQLAGWEGFELVPLDEAKVRQFIEAWYGEMIRLDQPRRAYLEIKRANLLSYFNPGDPNRLLELAANPLILKSLALAHTAQGSLPENRVQIYAEIYTRLLTHLTDPMDQAVSRLQPDTELDFHQISPETLSLALQEVAYQVQAGQPGPVSASEPQNHVLIAESLVRTALQVHLRSDDQVESALDCFRLANGLLAAHCLTRQEPISPNYPPEPVWEYTYAFLHPTLQDYLTALYLAQKADLGFEARQHITRGCPWRGALLLLGEYICDQEASYPRMDNLLNALAPAPLPQEGLSPDAWRAVRLAGELLPVYRRAFPQRGQMHRHIPRGLVNLLQARGASLPVDERAAAGDVLDLLGDPRFRPDAWYLPDEALFGFLWVPAGPFDMGSDVSQDPASRETEQPLHTLSLPDYYLGRYLVTVAQFKAFVEATGHQPDNPVSLNGRLSRPVVYVSWHDALRYCEWLTGQLKEMGERRIQQWPMNDTERSFWTGLVSENLTATLPSEAEWEKAARGPVVPPQAGQINRVRGLIYPWGNEFDPNKANTAETGLGTTSPVGCFPMGASPYGVLDMVGNTWEWTRTVWGPVFAESDFVYPYVPSIDRENLEAPDNVFRVIRGGSFFYHNWHTRNSSRGRSIPSEWDWDVGFRVAITPYRDLKHWRE